MSDISEKQTMEFFMHGVKKAKSAARELAQLNETHGWTKIRSMLGQIQKNADILFTSRAQTRLETLTMANSILAEDKKVN